MMDEPRQGSERADKAPTDDRGEVLVFRQRVPLTSWLVEGAFVAYCVCVVAFEWTTSGDLWVTATAGVAIIALSLFLVAHGVGVARNARVVLDDEGMTLRNWRGRERRVLWADVAEVQGSRQACWMAIKARTASGVRRVRLSPGLERQKDLADAILRRVARLDSGTESDDAALAALRRVPGILWWLYAVLAVVAVCVIALLLAGVLGPWSLLLDTLLLSTAIVGISRLRIAAGAVWVFAMDDDGVTVRDGRGLRRCVPWADVIELEKDGEGGGLRVKIRGAAGVERAALASLAVDRDALVEGMVRRAGLSLLMQSPRDALNSRIRWRRQTPEAHLELGLADTRKGFYNRATAAFDRALAARPDYAEAYAGRAVAWYKRKDYDNAWADVRRCRELGGVPDQWLVERLREASGRSE